MIALFFVIMTLLGALGGFFLKKSQNAPKSFIDLLCSGHLWLGACLYIASALLNIYLLKFIPYGIFLPLTSVTYIWTLGLSAIYLKERITSSRIMGLILIMAGIECLV